LCIYFGAEQPIAICRINTGTNNTWKGKEKKRKEKERKNKQKKNWPIEIVYT
jgi:hypothetical protein